MCGVIAAVARRDVARLLIAGLKALEYRGYDSAGLALMNNGVIRRVRARGKVSSLVAHYEDDPFSGLLGMAHTRWATHGVASEVNAHPHRVGRVAIVHNGIIENHAVLRRQMQSVGYVFNSETDTEVLAALIDERLEQGLDMRSAVQEVIPRLQGTYAMVAMSPDDPGSVLGVCGGSPLLVGLGAGEHFLASDARALIAQTRRIMPLHDGDIVQMSDQQVRVFDRHGQVVERGVHESRLSHHVLERGTYRHYMQKEMFEQPGAVADTLEARLGTHEVLPHLFGDGSDVLLARLRALHIVACGTSYHAGLVAKYWIEQHAGVPVSVEVASEYRYRDAVVPADTVLLVLSQSGETADTLAALRASRQRAYLACLAICNVAESSLVLDVDGALMTRAGIEVGVASTKAFTTQLVALALLTLQLGRSRQLDAHRYQDMCQQLRALPKWIEQVLDLDADIQALSAHFTGRQHALFLGRGIHFPVALEGALKLKEISYIHAEAYPAGELKHGPLALVDQDMPVVAVVPDDRLLDKLQSNLQEVRARGGELIVLAQQSVQLEDSITASSRILRLDTGGNFVAPAVFGVALQMLAYHVAVERGNDVDQPRNLAKAVTVE